MPRTTHPVPRGRLAGVVALVLATTLAARAADLDAQASNELNYARTQAAYFHNQVDSYDSQVGSYGDFVAVDLTLLRKEFEDMADFWEKAVAAFEKGQVAQGRSLIRVAEKAKTPTNWPERIACRQKQETAAPTDNFVLSYQMWAPEPAKTAFGQWVEARKLCAEAWGRAAEAMTPDADPARVAGAVDQAYAAAAREETAGWWYESENAIARLLSGDAEATSPELSAAIEQMRTLERQRAAQRLELVEPQRRTRDLERQRKQLAASLQKAFDAAHAARLEAARKAQK